MEGNMEKEIVISFKNVIKVYKLYKSDKQRFLGMILKAKVHVTKFKAVNNVSFEVYKGESIGILGRNGAGKSTLLKIITGVTFPNSGEVFVKGQVAALLELTAGFDLEMSGRENIYLKGYILGLTEEKIRAMEAGIVEFAEIGEFIDQPVRMYSSGMRARLGFAINAGVKPDILVIDEALSVGDAVFSEKCRRKVKEIIDNGATVLFVSHDPQKIVEFCSTAILMEKGKIIASGPVQEVVEQYNRRLEDDKKEIKK